MFSRLRKWLGPLACTPLHPQWLVLRDRIQTRNTVADVAVGTVLDIGCGDRWVESALDSATQYVALDYPNTVNMGYAGCPDAFGDSRRLPFRDECFDTVLLLDVLEHIQHPDSAMAEVRRVIKIGGRIVVQVPFLYPLHDEPCDFQRWTTHGLGAIFSRHGIEIRETTWHGRPGETAAALLAIALAKGVLDSARKRHFSLLLAPLMLTAIPVANVIGWLMGRLILDSAFMPLGYRVVGTRIE